MGYGYDSDKLERRGFINKNKILEYVSEKEVFALVFGFEPEEYQYVTSPLRDDDDPGCWFENTEFGFVFRDFNYSNKPLDCFDVVQGYYNIPNFYLTLEFVYDTLIKNKNLMKINRVSETKSRPDVQIFCESRNFTQNDGKFWSPYGITRQNLIDDYVFPIRKYKMINTKGGDFVQSVKRELAYVYTGFSDDRKKIYFPNRKKSDRFITNCKKDDIGCLNQLQPFGRQLIISKSYKDCRVLRNQGKASVWNQNEGMFPSLDILIPVVKRFDYVIVFYDNDEQGIKSSKILSNVINSYFPGKASPLWLPEILNQQGITDPADLYQKKGRDELNKFLLKI